ncbi:hypothetical protein [Bizionia sp.]|uniref:hypothetical protein n=1 Tax=Bizionia sp. TaxID=1954480 RepID=UPI003A8F9796
MLRLINLLVFILFGILVSNAQSVRFSPEMIVGNRSTGYQHFIGYKINDTWSINNISLFDLEHTNNKNNIFFIRNMLSYTLNKHFKANVSIGVKNPGKFTTLSSQYQYVTSKLKINYSIGSTYQNGFTLEQSFLLNYTPTLSKNIQGYINLSAVLSTNFKVLNRGIQQLRFGIKKEKLITGMSVNLDQFIKAEKTLENFGVFTKYNF